MTTTKLSGLTLLCAGLALATGANAQYKYVGPDGRTTYSDLPPPPTAKVTEFRKLGAGTAPAVTLPFELQQAVTRYPVTLYTGDKCSPCEDARGFLRSRGIPFTEKTVTSDEDIALFRQQSPDGTAPVITVGARRSVGYSQVALSGLLDNAGYPSTAMLPREYQYPAPSPLSPTTRPAAQELGQPTADGRRASVPSATPPAAATGSASGFRF